MDPMIPVFTPGDEITGYCTAAVTARRFLAPSADIPGGPLGTENPRVAHCGAGKKCIGVSKWDALINENVGIQSDHSYVLVTSGAAVNVGDEVMSDANGKAITHVPGTATNRANGLAIATVGATDLDLLIKLYS